ncbi:hypothetical protein [Phocaeicola sp.]
MEQQAQTRIKPTLLSMSIGEKVTFPYSRRKSVRSTASDLKLDKGIVFESKRDKFNESILNVVRTN